MHKIFALIIALTFACNAHAAPMPSSRRAEAVVENVIPRLSRVLQSKGLKLGAPVYIAIFKKERALELWLEGPDGKYRYLKSIRICAMSGGLGPKLSEGDNQAPEGFYEIRRDQLNPDSDFLLSLDLGFPNAYDRALGRTGSMLMIHGGCSSIGCYAMTDHGIEEIYTLVYAALASGASSVPVHIFPFRMTETAMREQIGSPWAGFWQNLKLGYDAFETSGKPPSISVINGHYVASPGP